MAKKGKNPDAMTGRELKRLREDVFHLTQVEMAKLIGVAHRTYIRMEGQVYAEQDIPLHHAKHVRCLLKAR